MLKWTLYLAANAFAAVIAKEILKASGVLIPLSRIAGGWLAGHVELAVWTLALLTSVTATTFLFWLVSRGERKRKGEINVQGPKPPNVRRPEIDARRRARYLREVGRDIRGRLSASLHHARFVDLNIDHDPLAVRPPWGYYNPERKRYFETIGDAFEQSERRLLILGHPGAGKTTALLHIGLQLVSAAETDDSAPSPFLVNLSKFRLPRSAPARFGFGFFERSENVAGRDGQAFETWLIAELAAVPGVGRQLAREWLRDGSVAVLLDGLDEFNEEQRSQLVVTLNSTFLRNHPDLPVVICSRTNEYEVLQSLEQSRLQLRGAVHLQPLSDAQIAEYLEAARAHDLLRALPQDPALDELSRTPLTLSMLVLAYGGTAPAVASLSFSETRLRLFESYVSRMLQRQARRDRDVPFDEVAANDISIEKYRYHPDPLRRWLGWLAISLSVRRRTAFAPDAFEAMLAVASRPQQQFLTFWVTHMIAGLLMTGCLLAVALPLVPMNSEAVWLAAMILAAAWMAVPLAAAGEHDWSWGIPFSVLAIGGAVAGTVALVSQLVADSVELGTRVPIIPLVLGMLATLFLWAERLEDHVERLGIPTAIAALIVLLLYFGPLTTLIPDPLRERTAIVLSWTSVMMGGILLWRPADIIDAALRLGIFTILFAWSIVSSLTFPSGSWPVALAVAACAAVMALAVATEDLRRGMSVVLLAAPVLAIGTWLGGPSAVPVGLFGLAVLAMPAKRVAETHVASLVETGERAFALADRVLLSALAWQLLACFGRLPFARRHFLTSMTGAFLLKKSGNEYEFIHRLLRDYFALRELMPRLAPGEAGRLETIRALGLQGEAAIDLLNELFETDDAHVRAAVVEGFSHVPSPLSTKAIERAAAIQDPTVRVAVIRTLAKLSFDDRHRLFEWMTPVGDTAELAALLDSFPIQWEYDYIIYNFVKRMGDAAVDPLAAAVRHGKRARRRAAMGYLLAVEDDRAIEALLPFLRKCRAGDRMQLIASLVGRRDPWSLKLWDVLLKDPDPKVRGAAVSAMNASLRH
ncbi:MAG TPA: NACHT domain-containing protein [Allosphingosinicella sp.]|nr:NACHT domain-containing protein [Allosphingosinicella sp.]